MCRCHSIRSLSATGLLCIGFAAPALASPVLATLNLITANGGGQTGAGAETNAMIVADGTYWSGGAAGLQGSNSQNPYLTAPPKAANITFKFDTAPSVQSLNAQYGDGNWAIGAARLSWKVTFYANNSRFGGGAGNFDIYWVSQDNWNATVGDARPNPPYATTEAALAAWSPDISLVRGGAFFDWHPPEYFSPPPYWMTYKTNDPWVPTLSYDLAITPQLLDDASAGGLVSFYLMSTSDTLGMTIFTGGYTSGTGTEGQPTLSLDIVAAPEPVSAGFFGIASLLALSWRRRQR